MSEQSLMDLQATRCPTAMIYTRRALEQAINSKFKGSVKITTIEQSMERDLKHFIGSLDGAIELTRTSTTELNAEITNHWLDSGEATEDEISGLTHQFHIEMKFL